MNNESTMATLNAEPTIVFTVIVRHAGDIWSEIEARRMFRKVGLRQCVAKNVVDRIRKNPWDGADATAMVVATASQFAKLVRHISYYTMDRAVSWDHAERIGPYARKMAPDLQRDYLLEKAGGEYIDIRRDRDES